MEKKRVNEWFALAILMTCFVPVVIDATVLHMAIPSLTFDLRATGDEVLWMIDIYSLIMAGLLLPMGILGDKVGHKNLLFIGVVIFTLASLMAGFSQAPYHLIASRVLLAVGGSMIMPASLASIRQNFPDDRKRAIALGIWVVFANGGAAIGPIFGGLLIDHFSWRAIFLINIPVLLVALPFVWFKLPKSSTNPNRKWNIKDALILLSGIILLVYFIKTILKGGDTFMWSVASGMLGFGLLYWFYQLQKNAENPMLDRDLLKQQMVRYGMFLTFLPMAVTSGFELLLSQELQLVHGMRPSRTALYITPFFLAFAAPGLFSAWMMKNIGINRTIISGLLMTAASFFLLAGLDFSDFSLLLVIGLIVLGFGLGAVMLAASVAILSVANDENAGTAGSLESVSYEMGVGLGVTFFGVLLSQVFMRKMTIEEPLASSLPQNIYHSINDALVTAEDIGGTTGEIIRNVALPAFAQAHSLVLLVSGALCLIFALHLAFSKNKFKR